MGYHIRHTTYIGPLTNLYMSDMLRSMKIGNTVVNENELRMLWSPCVYTVSKAGEPTYIGSSSIGYSRVLQGKLKHEAKRSQAFAECDKVSVDFFETVEEAKNEEDKLIHEHHPLYNTQCGLCGRSPKGSKAKIERLDEEKRVNIATAQRLVLEFGMIPPYRVLKERGLEHFYRYTLLRPDLFQ